MGSVTKAVRENGWLANILSRENFMIMSAQKNLVSSIKQKLVTSNEAAVVGNPIFRILRKWSHIQSACIQLKCPETPENDAIFQPRQIFLYCRQKSKTQKLVSHLSIKFVLKEAIQIIWR